jgi:hypothetical protein
VGIKKLIKHRFTKLRILRRFKILSKSFLIFADDRLSLVTSKKEEEEGIFAYVQNDKK